MYTTTPSSRLPATDPRHGLPEYLTTFAAMHDAMRRDALRLVPSTARSDAPGGPALGRWWARFERTIVQHHRREDDVILPAIVERAPHTAGLFDGLGDDHVHLDATMAAIGAAITADDRPALSAAATGFAALLDAHLTREESVVFPAIVEHVGGEAFGRIERQINADVSMRDLSFDVPWLFDDAPAELRARLVGGAPAALRLLLRLVWEPRYRRTSAVVRGGAR